MGRSIVLAFALSLGIGATRGQTYNGTATFATGFNGAIGLAFDTAGILYVANSTNSTISKVTSGGAVTTFVPNTAGLNNPNSLAFDTAGNLYVSNYGNNTISKVTSGGAVTTFVPSSAGLNLPSGLAFDTAGNLYVANRGTNTISKVTSGGTVTTFVLNTAGLNGPNGLAFDTAGILYVANVNNNTISKVTSGGTVTPFVTAGLTVSYALAFDALGNLYVGNAGNSTISKVTSGGTVTTFVPGTAGLNFPIGLAFDTAGNLYVANNGSNTVSKVSISYAAPTITAITPTTGSTAGGTGVTITGTNLLGATAVNVGANPATNLNIVSATSITATTPAGAAATVDITVTTVGGTSAPSAADQFTYAPPPTVTGITPTSGTTAGGTQVMITGTNFALPITVNFGATNATGFALNGATSITATAPAGTAGTVDLTVTTPVATTATSAADKFTYVAPPSSAPPPTVTVPIPVITSPLTYSSPVNQTFSYSIQASNAPTSYSATNIPAGCYINTYTGGITGTPTVAGTYSITIGATNAGGKVTAALVVTITSASSTGSSSSTGTATPLVSQTITFPAVATVLANAAPFTLSASSTSGLAITYTGLSGPATLSGNTVTLTGSAGTVTIQASQAGNGVYAAATPVTTTFQVTAAAAPLLVNLSARTLVTPGSPITAGFVIAGTTPKTVVLRGVGPTLSSFALTPALAHPQLTLLSATGAVLATNTTWGGTSALSTAFSQVGAFPLSSTSADSALTTTLAPGAYTMTVSDAVNDSGGLALAELYDASVDSTGLTQKLINLSSRGQAGTGNGVLVCGFVVTGNAPKNLLIRGVGPGLATYGLTGLLTDPVLNVYTSSGALVATNNDWGTPVGVNASQTPATAAALTATAAQVGAFPLLAGSKDAAVIISLPAGSYTVQVTGNGGTSGVGLAEVYEIPQ